MRLQAIKLAGFKSFVDPTTVRFPSNLCAIVGPNGCGKSNIIDAVRWVMGESSAKNLRGESMADVIFNGSTTRKPIGQASIELRFDNAEGRLNGEYASYNEISVQRKVTSDGQSIYYLNGQKCRRKDITDMFLGTGLGPRSYSIIEQGMISQLVEAKPEELRVHIEEAAGISKYKERRRETERRISHTRENLARLTDIREELGRQLHHLQRQAKAAERYKKLKEEERDLQAQVQAVQWLGISEQAGDQDQEIKRLEVEYEARVAEHRSIDAEIEQCRDDLANQNELSNETQKRYYDVGTEIARIEETIQHQQERLRHWTSDLNAIKAEQEVVGSDTKQDRTRISEYRQAIESLEPQAGEATERESVSASLLKDAEQQMHNWQQRWEEFSLRAAEPKQIAEVAQLRIRDLDESIYRVEQKLGVLKKENTDLLALEPHGQIEPLLEAETDVNAGISAIEEGNEQLNSDIEQRRIDNGQIADLLDAHRGSLQSMKGRKASLEALQQAALGQQDQAGIEWLEKHGLQDAKRLAERLTVESGWETAVETVLGTCLQAVCVDDLDVVSQLLGDLGSASIALLEAGDGTAAPGSSNAATLASKVTAPMDLTGWLSGILIAESLEGALEVRRNLGAEQSVITREGLWLGANWLRVQRQEDTQGGVLKRQQDLKGLDRDVTALTSRVEQSIADSGLGLARLKELEADRQQNQTLLTQNLQRRADLVSEIRTLRVQIEQRDQDLNRTGNDIIAGQSQLKQDQQSLGENRRNLEQALLSMSRIEDERQTLIAERDAKRQQFETARDAARQDKDQSHQLALQTQALDNQLSSTRQALERLDVRLAALGQRELELQEMIEKGQAPLEEGQRELAVLLQNRLEVEQALTLARQGVDKSEHHLRDLESRRGSVEEASDQVRSSLEEIRMAWQALEVRRNTISEQLLRDGLSMEQIIATLPEGATVEDREEQLNRMAARISRLGAINLAAIEEFDVQSERKQYLDAQNEDLESALAILQNAIRKIDRETRTRFKETFDQVNVKLQQLFPKLFGGGHAYLELTGEDLLDTGVGLMARPPGKRNSSVQLLSGGEKALTAIAMVFAIFSLNPAPFCMLDEVDAPLDDANVIRYTELVEEMSRTVQFIYITHNKISMEMANQLLGVTMHEPGVSRMVSVDVNEAVAMAGV